MTAGHEGNLHILLVEDHVDSARAMARLLRTIGYTVDIANTAAEGREKINSHGVDLLISDIMLADGSGLDLVRMARARRPDLRAIAVSGLSQSSDVKDCLDAGFNAHVAKPVDFNKLRAVIEEVVAN